MGRTKADGKLFSAQAIRDTNAHNSSSVNNALSGAMLFAAENTLNQAVSLQYQGSFDGTTWHDLGSAVSVVATSGKDTQTLTDPWHYVRCVATCSVAPASGTLTVWFSWREGA